MSKAGVRRYEAIQAYRRHADTQPIRIVKAFAEARMLYLALIQADAGDFNGIGLFDTPEHAFNVLRAVTKQLKTDPTLDAAALVAGARAKGLALPDAPSKEALQALDEFVRTYLAQKQGA